MVQSRKKKTQTLQSQLRRRAQTVATDTSADAAAHGTVRSAAPTPSVHVNHSVDLHSAHTAQPTVEQYARLLQYSFNRLHVYDYKLAELQQKLANEQLQQKYDAERRAHDERMQKLLLHRALKQQQAVQQLDPQAAAAAQQPSVSQVVYQRKLSRAEQKHQQMVQQLRQQQAAAAELEQQELLVAELADAKAKYDQLLQQTQQLHHSDAAAEQKQQQHTAEHKQPQHTDVWRPWPEEKMSDKELAKRMHHIEQLGKQARARSLKHRQKHKQTLTVEQEFKQMNEQRTLATPQPATVVPVQAPSRLKLTAPAKSQHSSAVKTTVKRPQTAAPHVKFSTTGSPPRLAAAAQAAHSSPSILHAVRPKTSHGKRGTETQVEPVAQHDDTDELDRRFRERLDRYEAELRQLKQQHKHTAQPAAQSLDSIFAELHRTIPTLNQAELERVKRQLQSRITPHKPHHSKRNSTVSVQAQPAIALPKRAVTTITESQRKRTRKRMNGTLKVFIPGTANVSVQQAEPLPVATTVTVADSTPVRAQPATTQSSSSHYTPIQIVHTTVPAATDALNESVDSERDFLQPSNALQSLTNSTRHVSLAQQSISQAISPMLSTKHVDQPPQFNKQHRDSELSVRSVQSAQSVHPQHSSELSVSSAPVTEHMVIVKPVSMNIAERTVVESVENEYSVNETDKYAEVEETKEVDSEIDETVLMAQTAALNAIMQTRVQATAQ